MSKVSSILIAIFIFYKFENVDLKKCYEPKKDFYPFMSSKTSYRYVRGNMTRLGSDCKPLQIWMMSRHGARYPSTTMIEKVLAIGDIKDQILKNHAHGAGQLCTRDLKMLRRWQLDSSVSTKTAGTLTPRGAKDLRMLAKRLRNLFPELLNSNDTEDYVFSSTNRASASSSLQQFASELLGSDKQVERGKSNSTLLPHKDCPTWVNSFEADRVHAERDKFTVGPEVRQLLKDMSRRLGFSSTSNYATVKIMYEMCRLETAWYPNKLSPWCSLFTKDELIVISYREDLDYYYCCGPGNKINAKLNCPSVKDMFKRFEEIENGKFGEQPKGIFYFAHSTNIRSLLSALHIGQDGTPPLASTFETLKNQTYHSSVMGPLNANLIAVLYKCADLSSPYKVMFYLNENLVKFDGCDNGVCDLQFLKQKFGPKLQSCSLNFCYEGLTS